MNEAPTPVAGRSFPWHVIDGAFLRLDSYLPFDKGPGGAQKMLGAYALVVAEIPNPDVKAEQRMIQVPIEHKSDYKALSNAHLDSGIKNGRNELVLLYQHRRGFFGGRKPRFHIAAYPVGTWLRFFDAVSKYAAKDFRWPDALFYYQPTPLPVFPGANCVASGSI